MNLEVLLREGNLASFGLGEVEEIVNQLEQPDGGRLQNFSIFPLTWREFRLRKQGRGAQNAVDGSANLVAHIGQELTLRPVDGFGGLLVADQAFEPRLTAPEAYQKPLALDGMAQRTLKVGGVEFIFLHIIGRPLLDGSPGEGEAVGVRQGQDGGSLRPGV